MSIWYSCTAILSRAGHWHLSLPMDVAAEGKITGRNRASAHEMSAQDIY
jgi:hypothetical protein